MQTNKAQVVGSEEIDVRRHRHRPGRWACLPMLRSRIVVAIAALLLVGCAAPPREPSVPLAAIDQCVTVAHALDARDRSEIENASPADLALIAQAWAILLDAHDTAMRACLLSTARIP